jgi:membrane protease YdiL (CAAX protease family)
MSGGFLYVFYLTLDIGILVGITAVFVFWAYRNNHFVLKNRSKNPSGTVLLISISVLLAVLPIFLFKPTIEKPLTFQSIIESVFEAQLALTVFEEVVFRGALWAYLRKLGLKDYAVFLTQAFLFWVAHSKYLLIEHSYSFWVAIPLASLLFGFMVWRSKSLTPSTIAHFLFNFTAVLIKKLL